VFILPSSLREANKHELEAPFSLFGMREVIFGNAKVTSKDLSSTRDFTCLKLVPKDGGRDQVTS
jgi:hypothetical protein